MLFDITAPLSPRLAPWPGDRPFEREVRLRIANGDFVDLSSMRTTLHAGTHADAPSHILGGAPTIDAVDLEPYLGPCEVVAVHLPPGARILPEHLPAAPTAPRVLFRTDSYPDCETFTTGFNAFSPELVHWLAERGCRLMGIDTPSVDPYESEGLESHRAIFGTGLRCLEGLRLGHVPPGRYLLSALPLRIEGGDGSPVRAVLLKEGA